MSHLKLFFNNVQFIWTRQINSQKHLGVVLNSKLTFRDQVGMVFTKIKRCLGLLCKAKSYLPRAALVTIFKTFIRHIMMSCDLKFWIVILIQCKTCWVITGAFTGTSRENLYQELESSQIKRWCKKLCLFYNILRKQNNQYLINLIPIRHSLITTRTASDLPLFNEKHTYPPSNTSNGVN